MPFSCTWNSPKTQDILKRDSEKSRQAPRDVDFRFFLGGGDGVSPLAGVKPSAFRSGRYAIGQGFGTGQKRSPARQVLTKVVHGPGVIEAERAGQSVQRIKSGFRRVIAGV